MSHQQQGAGAGAVSQRYVIKVVVIGSSGVGKTCIMQQYTKDKFPRDHKATVGVTLESKRLTVGNDVITAQFWDTAGQERFDSLASTYYRGSDACVIVFDVTDKRSFDRVGHWHSKMMEYVGNSTDFPVVLLANKCDENKEKWQVTEEMAKSWCVNTGKGCPYYFVSAKEKTNVDTAMFDLISRAKQRKQEAPRTDVPATLPLQESPQEKKGCC